MVEKSVYGVLGNPLTHSWSADYFTNKFRSEAIDWASFEKFEYSDIESFIERVAKQQSIKGFSVTMPYKQEIMRHLDTIHPTAKAIGAVNCVKVERDGNRAIITGYNTDVIGFTGSFNPNNKVKKALILGTGGASKAVLYGLKSLGFDVIRISRASTGYTYSDVERLISCDGYVNIVNSTPVGMYPDVDEMLPLPWHVIDSNCYLYDLIYNPEVTTFMQMGLRQKATVKGGLQMLHLQAGEAWKLWNG